MHRGVRDRDWSQENLDLKFEILDFENIIPLNFEERFFYSSMLEISSWYFSDPDHCATGCRGCLVLLNDNPAFLKTLHP